MTRAATEAGVRLTEAQWRALDAFAVGDRRGGTIRSHRIRYADPRTIDALLAYGLIEPYLQDGTLSSTPFRWTYHRITERGLAALEQHSRDTQRKDGRDG